MIIIAIITLFFSCGKKDNGPTGPERKSDPTKYGRVWSATTSENRTMGFRVTNAGVIDSLVIGIDIDLSMGTCHGYFVPEQANIPIENDEFSAKLVTNGNPTTTLHGIFNSESEASGTFDGFYSTAMSPVCGGQYIVGTGFIRVSAGSWNATKTTIAKSINARILPDDILLQSDSLNADFIKNE